MKRHSILIKLLFLICIIWILGSTKRLLLVKSFKDIPSLKSSSNIGFTYAQCSNDKKYLRFECLKHFCGGWADRLKGITTAYIWALLTKRHFSIDIKWGCPITKLLEPNQVLWNVSLKCYDYIDYDEKHKFSIASVNRINHLVYLSEFRDLNLNQYLDDVNLIVLYANLDFVQPMSENKYLKNNLLKLGFVSDIKYFQMPFIFRTIYNRLFKLTPDLEKRFNDFQVLAKSNSQKLFCAQIRIGGPRPNVHDDRIFIDRENSMLFWDFIKRNITMNEENYKIFITSDTETVVWEGIEQFGADKVIFIDGLYTHIDIGPVSISCQEHFKTILDLHAFQLCEKVVIGHGGFGLMGNYLRENPFEEFYRYTETFKENIFVGSDFIQIKNLIDLEKSMNSIF